MSKPTGLQDRLVYLDLVGYIFTYDIAVFFIAIHFGRQVS